MSDLEITRLCAEAMGVTFKTELIAATLEQQRTNDRIMAERRLSYDPLHDDAQAMALVKKMRLSIDVFGKWMVQDKKGNDPAILHPDLNRAICECVAKMQASKKGEPSVQT